MVDWLPCAERRSKPGPEVSIRGRAREHDQSSLLEIAEALVWSELPMNPGDSIVEIGSAPGGACQRLLELGYRVTESIRPRWTHWWPTIHDSPIGGHEALEVKRREFSKFRWLACDANVAPNYTLDTVEAIVTYPTSNFQGLVLTMKLSDWDQASKIDEHIARVRTWGFPRIKTRQLAFQSYRILFGGQSLRLARDVHERRETCLVSLLESREVHERRGCCLSNGAAASSDCCSASPVVPTDPPQAEGEIMLLSSGESRYGLESKGPHRVLAKYEIRTFWPWPS